MKYRKSEAKEYGRQHALRGVWAASNTPYAPDYKIDYEGFRHNVRHWKDVLKMDGMFVNGFMGESLHQTIPERKRIFDIAVEEANGGMKIMPYTSDPVMEQVLDMTKYVEGIGADFAIIINPQFYTGQMTDEGVYQYYKYVADKVNIGIVLFNQMWNGYLMSPQLIDRLAGIPNIVAIKHTGPRVEREATQRLCGDKIVVAAGEIDWLTNYLTYGVDAMIPGPTQYLFQNKNLRLIRDFHDLAVKGEIAKAWEAWKRLEPMRKTFDALMKPGKAASLRKVWTESLGMVGGDGRVRIPHLELTAAEKQAVKAAVESTELLKESVKVKVKA